METDPSDRDVGRKVTLEGQLCWISLSQEHTLYKDAGQLIKARGYVKDTQAFLTSTVERHV